jgi:D-apiose dehydrogenase
MGASSTEGHVGPARGSSQPLRIGLAGAGMISAFHLTAWSRARGAAVVALSDPLHERAEARAREFDIAAVYTDTGEMLSREHLDALDIAAPLEQHEALVRLCAKHGVAAMCQKPLAPSLGAARALVADTAGRIRLMVHENWRFRPYYRKVRAWLAEERLGRIQQCFLRAFSSGFVPDASGRMPALVREPSLRTSPLLAIGTLLIHHLDVVRALLGPLTVREAHARREIKEVVAETQATILLESKAGVPVLVAANMAAPGWPAWIEDEFDLIGTKASVRLRENRLDLTGPEPERIVYVREDAYQAAFDGCIQHFADGLRSGAPFETDGVDNLETLRLVTEALRHAGKSEQGNRD